MGCFKCWVSTERTWGCVFLSRVYWWYDLTAKRLDRPLWQLAGTIGDCCRPSERLPPTSTLRRSLSVNTVMLAITLAALSFLTAPRSPASIAPRDIRVQATPHRIVAPKMGFTTTALAINAAVCGANGVIYFTPSLRNSMIKEAFGVENQDFFSPATGAFMYLGGMHAAVGTQCIFALLGLRTSARDTLKLMVAVHSFQCAVGIWRMLASRAAKKAAGLWELLGAGGGPATVAFLLAAGSLAALI